MLWSVFEKWSAVCPHAFNAQTSSGWDLKFGNCLRRIWLQRHLKTYFPLLCYKLSTDRKLRVESCVASYLLVSAMGSDGANWCKSVGFSPGAGICYSSWKSEHWVVPGSLERLLDKGSFLCPGCYDAKPGTGCWWWRAVWGSLGCSICPSGVLLSEHSFSAPSMGDSGRRELTYKNSSICFCSIGDFHLLRWTLLNEIHHCLCCAA